jgi:uncharacterized protein
MRTVFLENRTEINNLIKSCRICFLAMSVDDVPYVLPMNFALEGDVVILHSAQSGRMWETIGKNPRVCISWNRGEELAWQNERVGCSYRMQSQSALVEGTVEFVEEFEEKERCMLLLMAQYSDVEFKFKAPAINNVGVIKVHIQKITAKEFGTKVR